MPGDFSGLQLAAYMFVGLRQIAPDPDPGIDFADEHCMAAAVRDANQGQAGGAHNPRDRSEVRGQRSGSASPCGAMLPGNELPGYALSLPFRPGPAQELRISRLRDHSKRAHTRL